MTRFMLRAPIPTRISTLRSQSGLRIPTIRWPPMMRRQRSSSWLGRWRPTMRRFNDTPTIDGEHVMFAQMMPDEGLDIILGQFPQATAKYTSPLNLALFTSQSATTVITHAQAFANITEAAYTSYARQSLAAATWGAAAERPTNLGRQSTYPQVTF